MGVIVNSVKSSTSSQLASIQHLPNIDKPGSLMKQLYQDSKDKLIGSKTCPILN